MSENILKPTAQDANSPEPLNSKVCLPSDNYVIRCKKSEFRFSKNTNNPMIVLIWELCKHRTEAGLKDSVRIAGKNYAIGGVELRPQYLTLTPDAAYRLFNLQKLFGMKQEVDIDNAGPVGDLFVGKVANAKCSGVEYIERRGLTDEEVASGMKREDAPALTYEDGSPVKGYSCELGKILEASSVTLPPPVGV